MNHLLNLLKSEKSPVHIAERINTLDSPNMQDFAVLWLSAEQIDLVNYGAL